MKSRKSGPHVVRTDKARRFSLERTAADKLHKLSIGPIHSKNQNATKMQNDGKKTCTTYNKQNFKMFSASLNTDLFIRSRQFLHNDKTD